MIICHEERCTNERNSLIADVRVVWLYIGCANVISFQFSRGFFVGVVCSQNTVLVLCVVSRILAVDCLRMMMLARDVISL